MTISITSRGSDGQSATSGPLTVGPFTPAANSVLMLALQTQDRGTVSVTGHGTWERVIDATWSGSAQRRTEIWACRVGASPSSATVEIETYPGSGYAWREEAEVFELTGDLDPDADLADLFGVWGVADGYDLSPVAITLAAFDSADNTTFVVAGVFNATPTWTWESGYTTAAQHANSQFSMQCGWIGAEDNSVSIDCGRYSTNGALAFEIKEAAAASGASKSLGLRPYLPLLVR